jgi:hypothetical protein
MCKKAVLRVGELWLGLSVWASVLVLRGPRVLVGRRPGQTTVEYLLLLAAVAGMAVMMGVLFYRRILGGLFTIVGLIIGGAKPGR